MLAEMHQSSCFLQELVAAHGQGVINALNADGVTPLQVTSELGNVKARRLKLKTKATTLFCFLNHFPRTSGHTLVSISKRIG
jgi:hypothetical protein